MMRLQFLGCGDAFGSGGRFNTCIHVTTGTTSFIVDCGATSLVAMKRWGIDRNAIDAIVITHFHGDHFGGVPFFILDGALVAKRTRPLTLIGPPGLSRRYAAQMDVAFPSFPHQPARFPVSLVEVEIGQPAIADGLRITGYPVVHAEAAGPCLGYRIEVDGKVLAYSGDSEWTESLIDIGRGADLFVCECYTYEREVSSHMNFATLRRNLERIAPRRLVLTHMSDDMLAHVDDVPFETASDGLVVEI